MLNEIEILCKIQEIDIELLTINKRILDLPKELDALKNTVSKKSNVLNNTKEELKNLMVARKKLELDLEDKLSHIQKLDGQLMQIKTNQEYKALEKQIFGLKTDSSVIEDKILENMEQAESVQQTINDNEKAFQESQSILSAKEVEIKKNISELEKNKNEYTQKKNEIASTLDKPLYKRYNRILQHKKDKIVVPVTDRTCGGCHFVLPPQVINDVYKGKHIIFCENCTRILYWNDTEKPDSLRKEKNS
ncbi:zinc ribbon domain-containing protein [Chlamydiota bacterium]